MTFVLSVLGADAIWMVADRRLSARGHRPRDDGRKLMTVETTDGLAILGYAGLGATARGTEPADWMSSVLRGRNLSLEASLGALADASRRELPRHLARAAPGSAAGHVVVAPAFVGDEPRLYVIRIVADGQLRFERMVRSSDGRPPPLAISGSGATVLLQERGWQRDLLRLVRAFDRRSVSARTVADHLAAINHLVFLHSEPINAPDSKTVGPSCIVAWRCRKSADREGGGHQFYTGTTRDSNSEALPTIAVGMDVRALAGVLMSHFGESAERRKRGELDDGTLLDTEELNRRVSLLPDKPDGNLR